MSTATAADSQQPRPHRRWWILATLPLLVVAGAAWLRTPRLDPRLFGRWTFLTTDNSGIRRFLTLSPDGTAYFTESRPGATRPTSVVANAMRWWVEDDVLVTQQIRDLRTTLTQMAQDTIRVLRMKKPEDRTDFRLRIVSAEPDRLRVSEVSTGVEQAIEIEMTRAENLPEH